MPEKVVLKGTLKGTIATTRYLEKYDLRLSPRALKQLETSVASGRFRLQLQHDSFRPWDATIRRVWIEDAADSESELKAEFLVDRAQHDEVAAEIAAAGGPGGLSYAASVPQTELDPSGDAALADPATTLSLAADAAAWSNNDRLAAGELLRGLGRVELSRLIELGAAETAKTILEIPRSVWLGLLIGAGSGLLVEALKGLVAVRKEPSVVEIHSTTDDEPEIIARIQTDDPEIVDAAIRSLGEAIPASEPGNFEYDAERDLWLPHNPQKKDAG